MYEPSPVHIEHNSKVAMQTDLYGFKVENAETLAARKLNSVGRAGVGKFDERRDRYAAWAATHVRAE